MATPSIHPAIDDGIKAGNDAFAGGYLHCHCESDPVQITVSSQSAHNHACGCSKCWKPEGAVFSLVAVVPRDSISVTANADKLAVRDNFRAAVFIEEQVINSPEQRTLPYGMGPPPAMA